MTNKGIKTMRQILINKNGFSMMVTFPNKQDIEDLKIGDQVENCFGKPSIIKEIYAKGIDINGKSYACYYTTWNDYATDRISDSMKQDRIHITLRLSCIFNASEIQDIENNLIKCYV